MAFNTINELKTFDFSQSEITDIKQKNDTLTVNLTSVIILPENSCNREFFKAGANELTLTFTGVTQIDVVRDGYRILNMDETVREEKGDEYISCDKIPSIFERLTNCPVYKIEKDEDYVMYVDTDDTIESYTIRIKAAEDKEDWERFIGLPEDMKY